MMFNVGNKYAKKDIYKILDVPKHKQKGSWDTGYRTYNNEIFIFVNVGTTARTGDDHGNYWIDNGLVWFGKKTSHIGQSLISKMVSGNVNTHIFCREDSRDAFIYYGLGKILQYEKTTPVKIVWTFSNLSIDESLKELLILFKEGNPSIRKIIIYERSLNAREACINEHGAICCVCGFDFKQEYGDIGENFIHIHHLNEVSEIKEEYLIDPKIDLAPVCPNCHAMLHRKRPAYTLEELKEIKTKAHSG